MIVRFYLIAALIVLYVYPIFCDGDNSAIFYIALVKAYIPISILQGSFDFLPTGSDSNTGLVILFAVFLSKMLVGFSF